VKTITYDDSLYCLVPIEPTDEMIEAAYNCDASGSLPHTYSEVYKAMLAASPTNVPPQSTKTAPNLIAADGCCDFD